MEEDVKVILACKEIELGAAVNAYFAVAPRIAQMETGKQNGIEVEISGIEFIVIKNLGSVTVESKA